eukprot:GEMP01034057.1.p1 GENE.GEMP01034057.1~~GEMP01034057.1.p1  ORF type:complete len:346 (+),score=85.38 GEMP01034057.1:100-1137(+)
MQRLSHVARTAMSPLVVVTPAKASAGEQAHALRVTLNRQDKLNALTLDMIHDISHIYDSAPRGSLLILEGAGKAFCAGGDVKSVVDGYVAKGFTGYPYDFFAHEYALDLKIASGQHRVCTFWHGICMGGGVGLGIGSEMRVVTETTVFAMPETKIGFFPDVGMTKGLSALRGGIPMGLYIGLSGARLGAKDMLFSGLATHFCPQDQVEEAKKELIATGKLTSRGEPPEKKAFLHEVADQISEVFSGKSVEEIFERLDRLDTPWAQETKKSLSELSPTSLRVTFDALYRHKDLPLNEVFDRELRMVKNFLANGDFVEGVTAALVEKRKPNWRRQLSEITDTESYFQ